MIEISLNLDLKSSIMIIKWESLQKELDPIFYLALLIVRAPQVKFYNVSELEHVNHGV
jgi:hypothetical protein